MPDQFFECAMPIGRCSALLFVLACNSQKSEEEWLSLDIQSLSHDSVHRVYIGYEELFEVEIVEIRSDPVEGIEVAWFLGEREVCSWSDQLSIPDATNRSVVRSSCTFRPEPDQELLSIRIRNRDVEIKQQEFVLELRTAQAPVVTIQEPNEGEMIHPDVSISFAGRLQLEEPLAGKYRQVSYQWISNVDGILGAGDFSEEGLASLSLEGISSGEHVVQLVASAPDGQNGASEARSILINALPVIEEILIVPEEPQVDDLLSCQANISDREEDPLTEDYSWFLNQQPIAENDSHLQLDPERFGVGDQLDCQIVVDDGFGESVSASASVQIQNTPPFFVEEALIMPSEAIYADTMLSCSASASDLNDGPIVPEYRWRNDTSQTELGVGDFLQLDQSVVAPSDVIGCTAVVVDQHGAEISAQASIGIENSPPVLDIPTIVPSTEIRVGAELHCNAFSEDVDDGPILPSYLWMRGGDQLGSGPNYTVTAEEVDVGDVIDCIVSVVDSHGVAVSQQASVVVENTPPYFTQTVAISPVDGILTGTELQCAAMGMDADDGVLVPGYQWKDQDQILGEEQRYTIDASETDVGDLLSCLATITDQQGVQVSATSTVSIENTPPVLGQPTIAPIGAIYNDATLSCAALLTEPDEILTPSYVWARNGSSVAEGEEIVLTPEAFRPGDEITCLVSVTDAQGLTDQSQVSVQIENRTPILDQPTLSVLQPQANQWMECTAEVSDPDGDALLISYAWQIDGQAVGLGAEVQLDPAFADVGAGLECVASVDDGDGGTAVQIASTTIANTPPVLSDITISSDGPAYTGTVLDCSATAEDLNDGLLSPSYSWSVGEEPIASGASYLVSAEDTDVGDRLVCTATVVDRDGASESRSAEMTVQNSIPQIADLLISSDSGGYYNDEILHCTASVVDPDQAPVISYRWESAGLLLGTESSLDLDETSLLPHDSLRCTVRAEDSQSAWTEQSLTIQLGDRPPSSPEISLSWDGESVQPHDNSALHCDASGAVDPDGEPVYYSYRWSSGFAQEESGSVVSAERTVPTEEWTCTVEATAGALGVDVSETTSIFSYNWADCPREQDLGAAILSLLGESAGDGVGEDYAVGDIDGDGLDDLLIGVWKQDDSAEDAGKSYLFLGASLQLDGDPTLSLASADYVFLGENEGDEAGATVAIVPDISGDGLADLLIGAEKNQDGGSNAGKVYVVFGSSLGEESTLSLSQADYRFLGEPGARIGSHLSSSDVDGDGLADLLIGAPYYDSAAGKVYLVLADSLGASTQLLLGNEADYSFHGAGATDAWIGTVSGGDFDGDGLGDIAIGAPQITDGGPGAAYLFWGGSLGGPAALSVDSADIVFSGEANGDYAGQVVQQAGDIDGDGRDELLISAVRNPEAGTKSGKIYLFWGSALLTESEIALGEVEDVFLGETANDEAGRSLFGGSDIDGDRIPDILIGAPYQDDGGSNAGKVYLFSGASLLANIGTSRSLSEADYAVVGTGEENQIGLLSLAAGDLNGDDVASFLVGASGNNELAIYAGCAFVNDPPAEMEIALSWTSGGVYAAVEDDLFCSASAIDPEGASLSYSYVWTTSTGQTVLGQSVPSSQTSLDQHWTCTATAFDGQRSTMRSKTVTIYSRFWENCPETQSLSDASYRFLGENNGDRAGHSVVSAGDVDGDGLDDILISAKGYDSDSGRVYLILGASLSSNPEISLAQADYIFDAENSGDQLGHSVASAGDIDGDGLDDILITAPNNGDYQEGSGKVYLILGAALQEQGETLFDLSMASYRFFGSLQNMHTGSDVAGVGDVDGDGLDDLMIGSEDRGQAYLFLAASLSSVVNLDIEADYIFYSNSADDQAGADFAAGDVDGDGLSDILISAPEHDTGSNTSGEVYLVLGQSIMNGEIYFSLQNADYRFFGSFAGEQAGESVAVIPDLDGDGLADIVIGSPGYHPLGGTERGRVSIIPGASLGGQSSLSLGSIGYDVFGEQNYDRIGSSVAAIRDLDGDGLDDLLVGAAAADVDGVSSGRAYVLLGKSIEISGWSMSVADYNIVGESESSECGSSLSGLGDVNGDGRGDILIAAPSADFTGVVSIFSACD